LRLGTAVRLSCIRNCDERSGYGLLSTRVEANQKNKDKEYDYPIKAVKTSRGRLYFNSLSSEFPPCLAKCAVALSESGARTRLYLKSPRGQYKRNCCFLQTITRHCHVVSATNEALYNCFNHPRHNLSVCVR
jgi:hypothetical protein